MDNLSVHHSRLVRSFLNEKLGLQPLFLPPNSCSRLNPIETLWSLVKKNWRQIMVKEADNDLREQNKIVSLVELAIG
jgi:transposase